MKGKDLGSSLERLANKIEEYKATRNNPFRLSLIKRILLLIFSMIGLLFLITPGDIISKFIVLLPLIISVSILYFGRKGKKIRSFESVARIFTFLMLCHYINSIVIVVMTVVVQLNGYNDVAMGFFYIFICQVIGISIVLYVRFFDNDQLFNKWLTSLGALYIRVSIYMGIVYMLNMLIFGPAIPSGLTFLISLVVEGILSLVDRNRIDYIQAAFGRMISPDRFFILLIKKETENTFDVNTRIRAMKDVDRAISNNDIAYLIEKNKEIIRRLSLQPTIFQRAVQYVIVGGLVLVLEALAEDIIQTGLGNDLKKYLCKEWNMKEYCENKDTLIVVPSSK